MTCPLCNDTGNQRYWEGRWRDEKAENERLKAALERIKGRVMAQHVYGVEVLRWDVIEVEAHDEDDARDRAHRVDGVIQVPPNAKVWWHRRLEK